MCFCCCCDEHCTTCSLLYHKFYFICASVFNTYCNHTTLRLLRSAVTWSCYLKIAFNLVWLLQVCCYLVLLLQDCFRYFRTIVTLLIYKCYLILSFSLLSTTCLSCLPSYLIFVLYQVFTSPSSFHKHHKLTNFFIWTAAWCHVIL